MNKIELFNFIEDNRIFDNIGSNFLVVDDKLRVHSIAYNPVEKDKKFCVGDYLRCSNAVNAAEGCGCHENCPQCPLRGMLEKSMAEMKRMEEDATMLLEHNQDFSVHAISTPFKENGRTFSIVLLIDRTAHNREVMLERIFFHDLLNLSGAINGLLDCEDNDNPEEIRGVLKSISYQMMEEIKSQRDLIYAINGMLKPNKGMFRADEVIDFVKSTLRQIASDMFNISLVIDSTLGDECVDSDKILINRVIHNMVKNACEANCGGAVIVRARHEEGKIIYSVHNDAVMMPDVKSKVFIQGNTTKKEGHGLGTYSMKLIGENYLGGKVYFKSEEGFGTEFFIELDKAKI
ncbi:MAG: sensor histidine kinase [Candidatus Cryptobacteroides sp.]